MRGRTWQVRILAGAMILAGMIGSATAQTTGGKPVAQVNGIAISQAEFDIALKTQLPFSPVEIPADRKKLMQVQTLSMMIDDILMQQFLAVNAPPVPPADVEKQFAEVIEGLKKNYPSVEAFYKESGTNEQNVRKEITARMQWAAYCVANLTEAHLQKYYLDNRDFFDGNTVRVSHIVHRVPIGTPEADKAKAFAQMNELRGEILARKIDFAEAAKKYSHCPSASKGGDLEYIPRKLSVEESFARAAFALQVGQISEVVPTEFGLHLIMVTDRKPGPGSDYTKVKETVRQMCMGELWETILANQRKAAKVEINLP